MSCVDKGGRDIQKGEEANLLHDACPASKLVVIQDICFVIDKTRKVKFLYNIIRFPL